MGNSTLPLGGGDATRISEIILQPGHSFVAGEVVRADETTPGEYVLAQADSSANAEAVGIIETVAGDSFELVYQGRVNLSGVAWTDLPFAATSEVWFLSDTVAGELTRTPPSTAGTVIKAMLVVTDDTGGSEEGVLTGYIGVQIGGEGIIDLNNIQPVGMIIPWAAVGGTTIPAGWALCDGQALSRSIVGGGTVDTFKDLFDLLFRGVPSLPYGVGDGSTTFNVPDLRGRVGVGLDGLTAGVLTGNNTVGDTGGEEDHILTVSELPDHQITLGVNFVTFTGGVNRALVPLNAGNGGNVTQGFTPLPPPSPTGPTPPSVPTTGQPHNTMQPFLVLNYLIRVTAQSSVGLLDHDLSQHGDVGDVSTPVDCDVLKFNAGTQEWEAAAPPRGDAGRNRLINGNFSIWQRETSFPAPAGALPADSGFYTADRWRWQFSGDGGTFDLTPGASFVEQATFDPGQTEVPDNPTFYMKWRGAFIGVVNGDEELDLAQQIENARTLAGQKATLSFWARGPDSPGTILVSTRQNLGVGGDVSDLPIFVPVALTTSWKKFVVVFDVQSIAGKTLGASDQFLSLRFTSILGADVAALTGSITVNYTDEIHIANVQFEAGDTATAFEVREIETEIGLCQRYFCKSHDIDTAPFNMSAVPGVLDNTQDGTPGIFEIHGQPGPSGGQGGTSLWPVRMRAAPSILVVQVASSQGPSALETLAVNFIGEGSASWIGNNSIVAFLYTADAEL